MSYQALKNLVVVQPADIVAEPFILHRQETKESGFPNALPAHQAQDFFILASGMKNTPDCAQQKMLHQRLGIVILRRAKKVVQAVADARDTVPCEAVQLVTDGMIPVLVGNDVHRRPQLLFAAKAVVLFQMQRQIVEIGIRNGGRVAPWPAEIAQHIHTFRQQIQANGAFQHRVFLQGSHEVRQAIGDMPLFRLDQRCENVVTS